MVDVHIAQVLNGQKTYAGIFVKQEGVVPHVDKAFVLHRGESIEGAGLDVRLKGGGAQWSQSVFQAQGYHTAVVVADDIALHVEGADNPYPFDEYGNCLKSYGEASGPHHPIHIILAEVVADAPEEEIDCQLVRGYRDDAAVAAVGVVDHVVIWLHDAREADAAVYQGVYTGAVVFSRINADHLRRGANDRVVAGGQGAGLAAVQVYQKAEVEGVAFTTINEGQPRPLEGHYGHRLVLDDVASVVIARVDVDQAGVVHMVDAFLDGTERIMPEEGAVLGRVVAEGQLLVTTFTPVVVHPDFVGQIAVGGKGYPDGHPVQAEVPHAACGGDVDEPDVQLVQLRLGPGAAPEVVIPAQDGAFTYWICDWLVGAGILEISPFSRAFNYGGDVIRGKLHVNRVVAGCAVQPPVEAHLDALDGRPRRNNNPVIPKDVPLFTGVFSLVAVVGSAVYVLCTASTETSTGVVESAGRVDLEAAVVPALSRQLLGGGDPVGDCMISRPHLARRGGAKRIWESLNGDSVFSAHVALADRSHHGHDARQQQGRH